MTTVDTFVEETLPQPNEFGSFDKILVQGITDEFLYPGRKSVTIHQTTLPEARGYWNIRGREHKVFYKKKHIATLLTEDCGLGSAKAWAYLKQKGFRMG